MTLGCDVENNAYPVMSALFHFLTADKTKRAFHSRLDVTLSYLEIKSYAVDPLLSIFYLFEFRPSNTN